MEIKIIGTSTEIKELLQAIKGSEEQHEIENAITLNGQIIGTYDSRELKPSYQDRLDNPRLKGVREHRGGE